MKLKGLLLLFPLLLLFSSCTGSKVKVVFIYDTEMTNAWKEEQTVTKLSEIFEEYANLKIDFQKLKRRGVFQSIKDDPKAFISKTLKNKDQMTIVFCVRPYQTIDEETILFEAIVATSLSRTGRYDYSPVRLTDLDGIIDTFNATCKKGTIASGDIFSIWEYTFKTKIITAFDLTHDIDWDSSDFTGYLEDFFVNNYAGDVIIEVVSDQDEINNMARKPFKYINEKTDPDNDKIGILFYFAPFYSLINERVEFEVTFATSLSDPDSVVTSEEMITSPIFILEKIADLFVDENFIAKSSFIFIGKPPKKCTVILNSDNGNEIQWKQADAIMALQDFFYDNYFGTLTFKETEQSIDLDALSTNPVKYITSAFELQQTVYDDLFLISIKPYTSTEFNKTGYELIFTSHSASPDDFTPSKKLIDDPVSLTETISRHFPEKTFDQTPITYLFIQGKTLKEEILAYTPYQSIDSMQGTYLLVTDIPDLMKKGNLEQDTILANDKFEPTTNQFCLQLVEYCNNVDAADLFYDRNTNQLLRKIYFIDYVTTGSSSLKVLYGPIDEKMITEIRSELLEKGFKTFTRFVYPYDFK